MLKTRSSHHRYSARGWFVICGRCAQLNYSWPEKVTIIWGLVCEKQVSRAGTSNYILLYLWYVITCSRPWSLLMAYKSSDIALTATLGVYTTQLLNYTRWAPSVSLLRELFSRMKTMFLILQYHLFKNLNGGFGLMMQGFAILREVAFWSMKQ